MAKPQEDLSPASPKILVVEDDVLIRLEIADALRSAGCSVVEAANAGEAQYFLQAGQTPDLIFSDVRMPGPMNGLEFARWVKGAYPSIPVVLTSGDGSPESIQGIARFVPKPYQARVVASLILEILDLHSS